MGNKRFLSKLKLGNSSMSVEVNLRESIMKLKRRWLQFHKVLQSVFYRIIIPKIYPLYNYDVVDEWGKMWMGV